MLKNQKRYQDCSKLEKFWRWRWYIILPFFVLSRWIMGLLSFSKYRDSLKECYQISIGDIEFKMGWYYTFEEVKEIFEKNAIEWNAREAKKFKTKNEEEEF